MDTLISHKVMDPKNIAQTWICIFTLLLAHLGNHIYQLHKILIRVSFIRVTGLYLSSLAHLHRCIVAHWKALLSILFIITYPVLHFVFRVVINLI